MILTVGEAVLRLVWAQGGVLGQQRLPKWASQRIKTRRGAKVCTGLLGMIIFIDDYFHAVAVGQVARPVIGRY